MPRRRDGRRDTLNAAETKDSVTLLVCPISAGTHAETTSARSTMSFVGIRSRKLTKIIIGVWLNALAIEITGITR